MQRHRGSLLSLVCLASLTLRAVGGEAADKDKPPRLDFFGDPLPDGAIFRLGTTRLRLLPYYRPFGQLLFDPTGKHIFVCDREEQTIREWEIATGREVRRFLNSFPYSFALSPDGAFLAVNEAFVSRVYEMATGKERYTIRELQVSDDSRNAIIAFSPDGKNIVALRGNGKTVFRWDAATGKKLGEWHLTTDPAIAFSPDTQLVASVSERENRIRLWDTANGKKVREWKSPAKTLWQSRCGVFSPDGQSLVIAEADAMLRVYETSTGKEIRSWNGGTRNESSDKLRRSSVGWLSFAPDGKTLASVDRNSVLRLWDFKTGRELHHFDDVSGPAAFSADGKMLAAGGTDARLRLWDVATGRDLCPFADPGSITSVAFSPNGRMIVENSDRGKAHWLNAKDGRPCKAIPELPGEVRAVSPTGGSLLLLRRDGKHSGPLCLVDTATGKERVRFADTHEDDQVGGWSPDGRTLITVPKGDEGFARVWDTATGKKRRDLCQNRFAACSPDGRTVAVVDKTATIRLVDVETGKEQRPLTGCSINFIYHLERLNNGGSQKMSGGEFLLPRFSPDGKALLTGLKSGESFALWDVAQAKPIFRLNCNAFYPMDAAFSPDGRLLTVLDNRGDPCLLDTATGRVRHRLTRQGGKLLWIMASVNRAFSADGRLFAAAYDAHTLVLWETATGQPIRTWPGHGRGDLLQMVFSSDNRRLATVGSDGTALVWDVPGLSSDGRLPAHQLTAEETEAAWHALAEKDAAKAHRALWSLTADPERALPLLRRHLHAVAKPDAGRLTQLLADLDSDTYAVRESATLELRKMGETTRSALRRALRDKPSLEVRRRVERLLHGLDEAPLSADGLRELRAVAVLEYLGNDAARQLLDTLAAGASEARLTCEAEAARARLRARLIQPGQEKRGD